MGFTGLESSECSSRGQTHRSRITKAGHWHATQLFESACAYQRGPAVGVELRRPHKGASPETVARARTVQARA